MRSATTLSPDPGTSAAAEGPTAGEAPILVVDDSTVSQRLAGRLIQKGTGRPVVYADDGLQALALLERIEPAIVLTDLQMPEMDGLELVGAIRARHPQVPVILMTAYGSEDSAMRALQAGAASYVPKKNLVTDLAETIRRVLEVAAGGRRRRRVLSSQVAGSRTFEVDNDPDLLVPLIDLIREDFDSFGIGDETARIRVAVALQEALANALYHGNLECSSDLRQEDERVFYDLADRRRGLDPYRSRRVHVESRIGRDEARVVIRDEGPGFDVAGLDRPFDPEDLMRVGGRGMILIRTFLDEVSHNEAGNQITLVKRK